MPSDYPTTSASINSATLSRAATSFIYASSSVSPGSPDETATSESLPGAQAGTELTLPLAVTQHNQAHATTSLNLNTPINLAAAGGNGTSSTEPVVGSGSADAGGATGGARSGGRTKRDMILIAHGEFPDPRRP